MRGQFDLHINGRARLVAVTREGARAVVTVDGRSWAVDAARVGPHTLSLLFEPGSGPAGPVAGDVSDAAGGARTSYEVVIAPGQAGQLMVQVGTATVAVGVNGRRATGRKDDDGFLPAGPQRVAAAMPGKVARVLVQPGDTVRAGQGLIVLEAMKMENELRAARDGRVAEVRVREAMSVEAGTVLVVIE